MDYDIIIIGAGPGGYEAALKGAKSGLKVALFESKRAGGTCLNEGCIPTKALLHSAKLYKAAKNSADIGVEVSGVSYNLQKMYEAKNGVVNKLHDGLLFLFKQNKIDYITEKAQILDRNTVTAGGKNYTANNIIIATGSYPAMLPIESSGAVYTSNDILHNAFEFNSVTIIGGGVIGIEFASLYNYLGKKVIIIEAADRVLCNLDSEVSQNLSMIFKKRGIEIYTSAFVTAINKTDIGTVCTFSSKGEEKSVTTDAVIVAVGRKAYTANLFKDGFLETNKGFIKVNKHFQTSIPNIYAIGDCIGGAMLAHEASAEGEAAIAHILGKESETNLDVIPGFIYSSPEIASTGLTSDAAKAKGFDVKIAKYVMSGNGKSVIEQEERGFVKLVFDANTNRILGGTLMCGRASDIIGHITFAVANGLTVTEFKRTVLPHPSFCEGVSEAVKGF